MIICRIMGEIVSTAKNKEFTGKKIMIVQLLDWEDKTDIAAFLTLDSVHPGVGDHLLVLPEGCSARIVFNNNDMPVQVVISAVIKGININNE